ncbi:Cobalt-zinc-cadmium resistance protein CzcD [Brevinematales bacterium NS]|nr:cation transporter [Brevinematales bacterium]QJR20834.1 Cobalt-zinc-cadmium resistance protein CzcD [Brevinematales bacterium NS]
MHIHERKTLFSSWKFWMVFLLNGGITVAEGVAGVLSGSLALLSDALHNLSDVGAVVLSFYTHRLSIREATEKHTYGYRRAEILAAFVNAIVLIGVSVVVIREAVGRFFSPHPPLAIIMVGMGLFTFFANALSGWMLHADSRHSLNIRSSYLHLLSDALFSLVVAGGGLLVWWKGELFWVDGLLSIGIALWMMKESWKVIRETVDILMQAAAPLDYREIQEVIEKVPGVKNIHHVHTWRSDEHTIYLEAHIEMEDRKLSEACEIGQEVEKRLADFGIAHVTLQYETDRCREKGFFGGKK